MDSKNLPPSLKLKKLLTPRLTPYIKGGFTTGCGCQTCIKTTAFMLLDEVEECFYGGAAGGGKSHTLLACALQYIDIPGYSALILRRSFKDLSQRGALMDKAREWLAGTDAVWNETKKQWRWPWGATLSFGYIRNVGDEEQFQSSEFQNINADEATQFTGEQYTYMFSRLRGPACPLCEFKAGRIKALPPREPEFNPEHLIYDRAGHLRLAHVPLRMRCAANPGGVGHEFFKRRFISKEALTEGRAYIPACLDDNAHLNRQAYDQMLMRMHDPVTREQLRKGNWDVFVGQRSLFHREWFQMVDDFPRNGISLVRYWDTAGTRDGDFNVGTLYAQNQSGVGWVVDVRRFRVSAHEVEDRMVKVYNWDIGNYRNVEWVIQGEPGSGMKIWGATLQAKLGGNVRLEQVPHTSKFMRARSVSASAEAGNQNVCRGPWNYDWFVELEQAGPDDAQYEHDDQWDSYAGAYNWVNGRLSGWAQWAREEANKPKEIEIRGALKQYVTGDDTEHHIDGRGDAEVPVLPPDPKRRLYGPDEWNWQR